MIVKNEEALLATCLKSLEGLDEVVVVDTGSTDSTVEIARKAGATVYADEYTWNDDFAEARNFAQAKCTGDWTFVIDADEELEPRGVGKIRAAVAEAPETTLALGVWIKGKGVVSLHTQPRLYRNRPAIRWEGMVHNYLNVAAAKQTDIVVMGGNSPAHKLDPDRALRMLEKAVAKVPTSARYWYYLGREYGYKKRWQDSEVALKKCLELTKWSAERADAQFLLARSLWFQMRGNEARQACLQAIGINPNFKEAVLFMGEMSHEREKKAWHAFAGHCTQEGVLFRRVA